MTRNNWLSSLAASAALLCASVASAITFQEIARFDVSDVTTDVSDASFIGNNPSAVAWNGRQLYVAGFNSSGGAAQTAIIEVTNAQSAGLNTAVFGPAFGALETPNLRGYSGLDLAAGVLAAAYDDGAADANGIQAYDPVSNSALTGFPLEARGGSGVAIDDAVDGAPTAVAWATFGSGRVRLNDAANGSVIVDGTNGLVYFAGNGTFIRDLDFDATTGDLYTRVQNDVNVATRNGATTVSGAAVLIDLTDAPFVAGQNLEFMETDLFGGVLIFNDRPSTGAAAFADVIKLADPVGQALSPSFLMLDGLAPTDGVGYYDFDFDPQTQTLALLDFANRNVHIFGVVPEPAGALTLLTGLLAGVAKGRRRHG